MAFPKHRGIRSLRHSSNCAIPDCSAGNHAVDGTAIGNGTSRRESLFRTTSLGEL